MVRLYLIFGLLISCAPQNRTTESEDTQKTDPINQNEETLDTSESDCVFNNDYEGLTTDWLAELNIKDFIWRVDLEQALIPKKLDTVFVSQGGCVHFGFLVELKMMNDEHAIGDSSFWVNKAYELAKEFKLEHYEQMINQGRIRKVQDQDTNIWFEIEDNDSEDNLFYNGIEIVFNGKEKRISISQYLN
ncbi:MAG: hypothetical protein R2804_09030 [Cyclobacteriaceae bacterium]